jgi:outer membrane biosynthesis protein TonB
MSYVDELLSSIELRLHEVTAEIASLEAARAVLSEPAPARRPAPKSKPKAQPEPAPEPVPEPEPEPVASGTGDGAPKPRRRRRRARRGSRAASGPALPAADLERMLGRAASGLSASEIAQETDASYGGVLKLLRELETSGRVRRTGTRRSTLWWLITDEERIAERAAELEGLSRNASGSS